MVDASIEGWGGVIVQEDKQGVRRPAQFCSGVWTEAERRYDATKRECRGLVLALRACKRLLFGTHSSWKRILRFLFTGSTDPWTRSLAPFSCAGWHGFGTLHSKSAISEEKTTWLLTPCPGNLLGLRISRTERSKRILTNMVHDGVEMRCLPKLSQAIHMI